MQADISAFHSPIPFPEREDLLSVRQAAKRLGMSKQWVYDHVDRCEPGLICVRFGPVVKFRPSDLDKFILDHLNAPRRRREPRRQRIQ